MKQTGTPNRIISKHRTESIGDIMNVITMMNKHAKKNTIGKNRLTLSGRTAFGRDFLSQSKPQNNNAL